MSSPEKDITKPFLLGGVLTITLAHFVHDIFTSLIAPMLPLLIENLSLSLFLAGTLGVIPQIPLLLNPFIGSLVDRGGYAKALVVVSPFVTCVAICLLGNAPTYAVAAGLLAFCGLAVAAIHLAAPVIMAELAGDKVGRGMSFFMAGGETARLLGPPAAVAVVASIGLGGMWKLIPLGALASGFLWWRIGRIQLAPKVADKRPLLGVVLNMRRVIIAVMGIMVARGFMAAAVTTYLPTFRDSEGATFFAANAALFLVEAGGVVGAFTSGTLSDRFGRRTILLLAVIASPPLMLAYLMTTGPLSLVFLVLLGFFTLSTTPVMWALMIEHAGPDRAAASGTFTMISFAIRGLIILLVGNLGDQIGLRPTYYVCAIVAIIGIPFVFLVPKKAPG